MGCQFSKPSVNEPQKIKPVDDIVVIPKKDTEIQNHGTKVQNETPVKQSQTQHQATQVSNKSLSGELILYPQTTDNLEIFIKLGTKKKLIHLQARNKYIDTVEEIIRQIQLKSLTFSNFQSICQKQDLKVMDAMFLRNDSDETILTLILTYIDNYEIITELLINHKLPEKNYELLDLAVSLLRKFRPQSQIDKIQMTIEFLDEVKSNEQLQKVFNSFEDPKIYRVKNAIMYAQNCISYFNHKKQIHLLLFRKIAKLFKQSLGELFQKQYRSWKQSFAFNHLKIPKAIPKTTSTVTNLTKIELQILNYSLFHEIANKENWELFVQYSNPYYHQKSLDQRTPFWIFFQKAPISIIVEYIQQYPKQLEQNINYITTQGLTLIHCLCKNKNLKQSDQETIKKLIDILEKNSIVKTLLNVAYQDQIPLVYYLDTQRVISSDMVNFLSSTLVKQFSIDNLEMESYKIADSILNGKTSLRSSLPHFSNLSKVQLIQLITKKKQLLFNKDEKNKQTKEYQNFTTFYQHYIQLAKQIIKYGLFEQFPWIQNYSIYSSHIPYDIGNISTSLLYTLLVSKRFQQLKIQIESICKSIDSQQYQQKNNLQECQKLVQQISRVLFIYQELFNYPECQELQQLISDTIYNQIQKNPQIIQNKIYGFQKNESMADNLYLQYIMSIKAQKEEYNKFINMLIERLDKNLFKGKEIKIKILFQNYNNFQSYKLNLLEKLLPQQDQLIIPLEIQSQNIIQDSVSDENFQNYYAFKNILQEIIDKDKQFYCFIKGKTVILRSNSICQLLLDKNSKLHELYRGSFFRLDALWRTSKFIKYDKQQIIPYILDQQNLIVQINTLEQNQLEQLFDWQLYGMRVKLNLNIKKTLAKLSVKLSLKEQVIYNQIKSNQQFWINLIIYDELNSEVTEYFNRDEDKPQLINYDYFPLSEIISNNSYKNLQFLIQLKKISQYELVQMLAQQFFIRQTSVVIYQPLKEKISLFNAQMKLLIEQISTNTFEIQKSDICILTKFINYLEVDTFSRFNKQLLFDLIKHTNLDNLINKCLMYQQVRSKEYYFSPEWQDQMIEIILDIWKENYEELHDRSYYDLGLAQQRSPAVAKWMCERQILVDKSKLAFATNPLYFYFYSIFFPNECFEYLEKIKLNFWMIRFLFGYFINLDQKAYPNKKKLVYQMINLLRRYGSIQDKPFISNIKNYDSFFDDTRIFQYHPNGAQGISKLQENILFQRSQFKYRSEELKYMDVMDFQEYMILSKQEYSQFIDTINLDENEYLEQISFFIHAGVKDKLQVIFNKLKSSESFQKIYNVQIFTKKKCLEHEFGFKFDFEFEFEMEIQLKFPYYFSFQKLECDFVNFKQSVDYLGTFKYLNEELKKQKLEQSLSVETIQINALLDSLIFPNTDQIKMNQQLINILIQLYQTRKSNSKFQFKQVQNRRFSEFLAERADLYIKLLGTNIQNCEVKFTKIYYFTPFQSAFFEQLLILLSQDKNKVKYNVNEIANLILKNNFKNEQFNKIIQNGAMNITNVNSVCKYYFKKSNLIKSITLNYEHNCYQAKFQFLKSCMTVEDFSFDKLQITEIAFILKAHEFFDNKLVFNQKYLVASLLSNNLETIIYAMELHKDPVKLGFEQNVFQILTIYSNEKDIITYYNKFVYKKISDNKRLFQLNNVPLLYYIAYKRYSRVFYEVYLKQLQLNLKENDINQFISEQLQQVCFESDAKIYQIALQQKSYFLLDYMKSFIKAQDIEQYVYIYDFNVVDRIKSYPIQSQIIQEFIKSYQQTEKFHKFFHKQEIKLPEQGNKVLDDQNNARKYQIELLIQKEQATLMKIFGFNQEILKFVEIHHGFSFLVFELVMSQLSHCKGNPQIIKEYIKDNLSQNKAINKDIINLVIEQVQGQYILDHPVFQEIIQLFPTELQNSLKPQNLILENSLALALGQNQSNQQSLAEFITKQLKELYECQDDAFEEYMDANILLVMKLINKPQFTLDEQETFRYLIINLPEQILLSTIQFLIQNKSYEKKEITQNTLDFLVCLISKRIIITKRPQLWSIVSNCNNYLPAFSEILYLKKIEKLCEQLKNYLIYLGFIQRDYQPEFIVKFENEQMYQSDDQIILPLEYNKDELYFSQEKYDKLIEQLKKIRLEKNIKENINEILNLSEYQQNDILGLLEGNYSIDDMEAPHLGQQNTFQKQVTQFDKQSTIFEKKQTENPNSKQVKQEDIQFIKQNYDFMLELVNNNNYKVRDSKVNKSQIIFMEYYHFFNPLESIVTLEQCTEAEFLRKYNGRESISFVISQFYQYHENLKSAIANEDLKQWQINYPYYVKDEKFYSEKSLFSTYTIQVVFQKLHQFHENVKQYAKNLGDVEKIQWRISAISTLEVLISNMIDFNTYDNKPVDILSLLDSILNWNTLIMILLQVLYCNMLKYQNILSVLRRIYVEFNEIQDLPFENTYQEGGLDQYFRFGQTHYFLQQQTLVVRLNIMNIKKQPQLKQQVSTNRQNQSHNFLKQQEIDYYYCNIINEEDLLFQIFNSKQIIQYIFAKLDVDRKLQQVSQNLSKMLNKDVIITVNHQSLLDILQSEIQQIRTLKDRKQQLRMQTQIKELLIKLSEFFLDKSEQLLIEQLQSHNFEYQFQTKLSSLLHSLRQGFNRSQDELPNHRKIVAVQKAKVITKIRYPNRNCDKIISLYFGFQLKPNFYMSKNQIGDLLIVVHKNEYQYLQTTLCQLVDNSRQGKLVFYQFDESSVSTLSQEQLEQYCAMSNKMRKKDSEDDRIEIVDNEDIIAVILFEKGWPDDPDFINNMINLYVTDQNGNLYFIHEQRLAKKLIQIQETDSESIKRQLLDIAFGKNQVQTYSQFTVAEIIPIFPNQILYEFESGKTKQSKTEVTNCQKMIIKINDIDFQIDKLKLDLLNIASYFDSNDIAQYHVKQLTQFKESHNELSKIQMIIKFSDDFNSNPSYYLDNIMQSQIAFVEFQQGYETFFTDKYIPQVENALGFMFDINQQQIKKNLLMSIFKVIEFTFDLTTESNNQLIFFENGVLKLKTFLIQKEEITKKSQVPIKTLSIEVPSGNKIGQFLNQLIINFTKYNFSDLLMEKAKFEIIIDQNYEKQFEQEILILLLMTKYLHKLIAIKNDKKILFLITQQTQKSIQLYQFSKDRNEVQLFYERFQDFRLEDFLLDYLNNYTNQYQSSYNELDKKILSKNQLMMQSMILSADDFIRKEKQQVQQSYELNIHYGLQKIKKLEGRLDPRDFETAFIIVKGQVYQKVVCIKSCQKYSPLVQYLKQNSLEQKCGFPIYILINGLQEYLSLDEQLSKIKIITKNNVERPLSYFKNYSTTLKAKVKFITSNIIFIEFNCSKPLEFTIQTTQYQVACIKQDYSSEIKLKFLPTQDSQMYKYYHTGVWFENEFKNIVKNEQQNKIKEIVSSTTKFLKLIMKSLSVNEDMKMQQNQQNINLNQILSNNVLNIQSRQLINQSTKVGSERLDVIEIKDNFENMAPNFTLQTIVFVHSIYQKIQIVPNYTKEDFGLKIYWEPQIKGIYYLYINNYKVDSYFVVLANSVDVEKSKLDFPEKLKTIPYYQEITFNVFLKDKLQNIYGSIENALNAVKIEVESSHKKSNIEQNYSKLSLEGKIEVSLRVLPIDEDDITEVDEIELVLKINDIEKMKKKLELQGVSFEKNMQDFQRLILYDNEGKKIYKVEKQLLIVRANFLDSLLKLKDEKLIGPLMIKFINEPGYDQGGPRKEFYSLIGNELKGENLKSEQYGYFSMLAPGYYYIDPKFLNIPKKNDYAYVFGKFVANSIFNNHQIGIQFQPQFWKVIFSEKIQFKDLNGFLDPITFQNYEMMLSYDEKTLESLGINFTYQKKKELIQLIPDGQNVTVNKENCSVYLDKVAEYVIQTQYQDIYTPFISGFQSVLEIKDLKKFFKPNDMGLITLGVQDIKPEQILNILSFKGGQDYHISFFTNYVNTSSSKRLKELLQYITGSPTLPSNEKFKIQVEFKQDLKDTLIPTTRTCFNLIELPLYKSYQEMKQKLDTAISYGLIGFGIF
ncbi:unnamed protein product (macronuclear) [Paramecium tetraurelia]|uniref:HECT domain-containing protein n=1 Tax=Paramecium tetraurelia TaxID=5888 RepID=A0BRN4_PARTE|nr:uncharacterized protein GSPATT00031432001 [Paramecium tetraurelia]CAK61201.1 unnamed protein product [Paramecium tetraurelia]|eukprot:XP_001428599.1 hypothetical protein (macronuclear) [Paramecium tetraurelia strain d4-2]